MSVGAAVVVSSYRRFALVAGAPDPWRLFRLFWTRKVPFVCAGLSARAAGMPSFLKKNMPYQLSAIWHDPGYRCDGRSRRTQCAVDALTLF
jgi:hypothetical protein